jgi:hypothetical protein
VSIGVKEKPSTWEVLNSYLRNYEKINSHINSLKFNFIKV